MNYVLNNRLKREWEHVEYTVFYSHRAKYKFSEVRISEFWVNEDELSKKMASVQFSSVTQLCLTLCVPTNSSTQASLYITNCRSLPKPMSIESVMPSNHLILILIISSSCPQFFPHQQSTAAAPYLVSEVSPLSCPWPRMWGSLQPLFLRCHSCRCILGHNFLAYPLLIQLS